jgi:hypothetical protein
MSARRGSKILDRTAKPMIGAIAPSSFADKWELVAIPEN